MNFDYGKVSRKDVVDRKVKSEIKYPKLTNLPEPYNAFMTRRLKRKLPNSRQGNRDLMVFSAMNDQVEIPLAVRDSQSDATTPAP